MLSVVLLSFLCFPLKLLTVLLVLEVMLHRFPEYFLRDTNVVQNLAENIR